MGVVPTHDASRMPDEESQRPDDPLVRFRGIVDQLPTLAWVCGPDGTTRFLNRRWLEYTGLSHDEALGWGWKGPVHPDDIDRLVDTWMRVLSSGEAGEEEARIRRFDGEYRWFLYRAVPVRDETGEIVRWYGTNTDIEDLKRGEAQRAALQAELEREHDRLQLLLDVSKTLVSNLDLRSLFDALAESMRRAIGCDFIGLALPDPPTGNLRQRIVNSTNAAMAQHEGMIVPVDGSMSGRAFQTRTLLCVGPSVESRIASEVYATPEGEQFYGLMIKEGFPRGCFLPLVHGDDVIGVIQLTRFYAIELLPEDCWMPFGSREAEFLRGLAGQLSVAVANALEHEAVVASRDQLERERVYLREEIDRSSMFEEIVGSSKPLRDVLSQVTRVAPTDSTVLLTGETGTGKELLARAIHTRSGRATRPFIRVNCAAIPPSLIASELFGHEKGSFTGAQQRRLGRFELADKGTIFLDEVGELPMETQISLLRVLQEREFERLGGTGTISVDVRVISATNRDLGAAVADGTFREDLFYRLNVFPIRTPSLRERADDIPLLVEYLIDRYATKAGKKIRNIERKTLDLFQSYAWPGNVRELQNVIERAVIFCDDETFSVDETWLTHAAPRAPRVGASGVEPLRKDPAHERRMIETALAESRGRVAGPSGAAAKLGIPRQTLESMLARLGIDKHRFKSR